MQKTFNFFYAFLLALLGFGVTLIAEEITLTTYYPAPYGAYDELTVTGNVGIGTTEPKAKLDINGWISLGGGVSGDYGPGVGGTSGRGIYFPSGPSDFQRIYGEHDGSDTSNLILHQGDNSSDGVIFRFTGYISGLLDYMKISKEKIYYIGGNVGIGTADPTAKLDVTGNIKASFSNLAGGAQNLRYLTNPGVIGYDIAELFDASEEVEPGDVLVIDEANNLKLRKSRSPYEKGVIGIVSGSPAILFEGSHLEIAPIPNGFTKGTKPPVALTGRIQCKVSIENGPIERGDFLTSSSIPGHAMKALDREKSFGAIIGKALEPFNSGPNNEETGKIIVLVTLQ